MIIDCISDLHGHYPELEGGDLLIVAGDVTASDARRQWIEFICWISVQKYKKRILIGGNHDNYLASHGVQENSLFVYLEDSGTEFEGLKIWGSPWTKTFEGMNPHCKAFTCDTEEELGVKFSLIPNDVDILVTHSPPFTILDTVADGRQEGSPLLMAQHIDCFRPKLWVFGHIHESYGQTGPYEWSGTKYVNASHVNERYEPVNKPIRIELCTN